MKKIPSRIEVKILQIIMYFLFLFVCVYAGGSLLFHYTSVQGEQTIMGAFIGTSIGIWFNPGFRDLIRDVMDWMFDSEIPDSEDSWGKIHNKQDDLFQKLDEIIERADEKADPEKYVVKNLKNNQLED